MTFTSCSFFNNSGDLQRKFQEGLLKLISNTTLCFKFISGQTVDREWFSTCCLRVVLYQVKQQSDLCQQSLQAFSPTHNAWFDFRVQKQDSWRVCAAYTPASINCGPTHPCRLVRQTEECLTHQKCQWAAIGSKHRAQPIPLQQAFSPGCIWKGCKASENATETWQVWKKCCPGFTTLYLWALCISQTESPARFGTNVRRYPYHQMNTPAVRCHSI